MGRERGRQAENPEKDFVSRGQKKEKRGGNISRERKGILKVGNFR